MAGSGGRHRSFPGGILVYIIKCSVSLAQILKKSPGTFQFDKIEMHQLSKKYVYCIYIIDWPVVLTIPLFDLFCGIWFASGIQFI